MKMKTEETIKLIKYVTGSVAAVLLAAAMQLNRYGISTIPNAHT